MLLSGWIAEILEMGPNLRKAIAYTKSTSQSNGISGHKIKALNRWTVSVDCVKEFTFSCFFQTC